MENPFIIDVNDNGLSIKFKTEANIKLASVKNKEKRETLKMKYQEVLHVIKAIEYNEPQSFKDVDFILEVISVLTHHGILSPLTLFDDEFESIDFQGYFVNKRYSYIRRSKVTGLTYNTNAFNCFIRAAYDEQENEQMECIKTTIGSRRLYISKGGIITGAYIEDCVIPSSVVAKHEYSVQEPVEIPVCKIIDNREVIYVVDHRCPQLKTLAEKYVNPIQIDIEIKNKHYNLRKYKKLNKV